MWIITKGDKWKLFPCFSFFHFPHSKNFGWPTLLCEAANLEWRQTIFSTHQLSAQQTGSCRDRWWDWQALEKEIKGKDGILKEMGKNRRTLRLAGMFRCRRREIRKAFSASSFYTKVIKRRGKSLTSILFMGTNFRHQWWELENFHSIRGLY